LASSSNFFDIRFDIMATAPHAQEAADENHTWYHRLMKNVALRREKRRQRQLYSMVPSVERDVGHADATPVHPLKRWNARRFEAEKIVSYGGIVFVIFFCILRRVLCIYFMGWLAMSV
jgi:hypothetical protein